MRVCAALAFCLLAGFALGAAGADRKAELDALKAAIRESRERVQAYEREQRGLLEALEAIERAASEIERELALARAAARQAGREVEALQREAAAAAFEVAGTQRALAARAVALYRAGELGSLRLVFSSQDLSEFLARVSMLRRLLVMDSELLVRYREQSARLAQAVREAETSALEFAEAERGVAQRAAELEGERQGKRRLVARVQGDRGRERSALAEMERAARALEETLQRLGSKPSRAPAHGGPPFASLRSRLPSPVDAPIVRRFGKQVESEFMTATFQSGVVFGAPLGRPVRAVAAGRVRFSGWFRGYGKLVIVDHGDEYFTICGHLGDLAVAEGDEVSAGQTLGSVGETGSLSGPQLYFEIRQGARAEDPAGWLR